MKMKKKNKKYNVNNYSGSPNNNNNAINPHNNLIPTTLEPLFENKSEINYNLSNANDVNLPIMSSEAEELTVQSKENRYRRKTPKVIKLGVSEDGFEEYDIDFGDAYYPANNDMKDNENDMDNDMDNENTNHDRHHNDNEVDNAQILRHQLLDEQLRVEELKRDRKKSILAAQAFQEELYRIKKMSPQEFEDFMTQEDSTAIATATITSILDGGDNDVVNDILPKSLPESKVKPPHTSNAEPHHPLNSNTNANTHKNGNSMTLRSNKSKEKEEDMHSQCGEDCECHKLRQLMKDLQERLDEEHMNVKN